MRVDVERDRHGRVAEHLADDRMRYRLEAEGFRLESLDVLEGWTG